MTMTDIEIRPATVEDAAGLARFNCEMALETEDLALEPDVVAAGVRALFEHPERGFYVVADAGGEMAGALMVTNEWSDWRNGMFWWIQSVYVAPAYRRRGVYRSLYRFVEAMARNHPEVCGFRLYVERENSRAQQTYESLGMKRTPYLVYESLAGDRDGDLR
jgi:ribosomal protein S18 acetylase RimI-like enzyme